MSFDDVYVFKSFLRVVTSVSVAYVSSILPVNDSIESNLPLWEPLVVSNESNLPSCEPLVVSNESNLSSEEDVYVLNEPVSVSVEKSTDPLNIVFFHVATPEPSTASTLPA